MKKSMLLFVIVILSVALTINVFAHPDSNVYYYSELVEVAPGLYHTFIGSIDYGWVADLDSHTDMSANSSYFNFRVEVDSEYLDDFNNWESGYNGSINDLKTYAINAANFWDSVVDFEYTDSSQSTNNRVTAKPFDEGNALLADAVAVTTSYYNASGHKTRWEIAVNIKEGYSKSVGALAHEFGHVIGLQHVNDTTKLMHESSNQSSPAAEELIGAKVITGQHSHNWNYVTIGIVDGYSQHRQYCYTCKGYIMNNNGNIWSGVCQYDNSGKCIYCRTSPGTDINSQEENDSFLN